MRERLARAHDKAGMEWLKEHNSAAESHGWADVPTEVFVDAILNELEKPTPEMVEAGFKAAITSDGLKEDDLTVGDVRKAKVTVEMLFTAAIRAAKETK